MIGSFRRVVHQHADGPNFLVMVQLLVVFAGQLSRFRLPRMRDVVESC